MARGRQGRLGTYTAEAVLMVLVLAFAGAAFFVGWVVGHYATGSTTTKTVTVAQGGATTATAITKAPNFTADDLSALPEDDWPTVGGNLGNERYSPLDQIDTSNVSQVKGMWMTHLGGSGIGAKYS